MGIFLALMVLLFPLAIVYFNGTEQLEAQQSLCPFKMLTGFPCPGCGITKSMISFYKGDLIASFQYHIFGPFVIIFCIVLIFLIIIETITKKNNWIHFFYNKKIAVILGITLTVYHSIRLIYFVTHHNVDAILKESIWK